MALTDNADFMADLRSDLSLNKIAAKYGVARSTVQKLHKRLNVKDGLPAVAKVAAVKSEAEALSFSQEGNDGRLSTGTLAEPLDDLSNDDILLQFGRDPKKHRIVGTLGERHWWMNDKWNHWYAFKTEKITGDAEASLESILERVKGFTFVPEAKATGDESLIVVPTDIQAGKTDWNGHTEDTVEQALASFHKAAEIAKATRPAEIVMVDAGDPIENIYSTSSQLGTNDRDLPHQVEVAAHILLSGIEILAPHAPSFRYAAVSSNHGAHRLGPKSPAGDVHADYGIVIAKMIGRALTLNRAAFGHVTVQTPDPYHESLVFDTSGSRIGVVHGHQAGSADKIGEWWKGQSHGRMPTGDARILIAGHFHSLRVQQSGDARWIMVGPASDRGSSWFTNSRGESSQSGMMSFLTRDNEWDSLKIL